ALGPVVVPPPFRARGSHRRRPLPPRKAEGPPPPAHASMPPPAPSNISLVKLGSDGVVAGCARRDDLIDAAARWLQTAAHSALRPPCRIWPHRAGWDCRGLHSAAEEMIFAEAAAPDWTSRRHSPARLAVHCTIDCSFYPGRVRPTGCCLRSISADSQHEKVLPLQSTHWGSINLFGRIV